MQIISEILQATWSLATGGYERANKSDMRHLQQEEQVEQEKLKYGS